MSSVCDPPNNKKSLPSRGLRSSSEIWTKEKAERDEQLWGNYNHMWVMENKVYDLTAYTKLHPGGRQWIQLTKGQDITEHFITHHLNEEKARSVLQKYYVKDVEIPQASRFTFEDDGLYRRIKRKVLQKYKPKQLQDWSGSVLDGVILLTIWLSLFIASGVLHSYILASLCGISIYPILGVAHNFIHMRWHPFRYLWLLTGFTHQEWQRMHCLSHHSFSNTLLDYEIQALEPIVYYLRILPKNTILKGILKELIFPFTAFLNIILKLLIVPIINLKRPEWFYLVPLIQIPFLYLLAGEWNVALNLFMLMHIGVSFTFMKLTFLGHRTGREWTEGNQQIRDFGQHQIVASSDAKTNHLCGFWSYIKYAGFNFHAVHHMFPTIDNHFLPKVDEILVEQAKKIGICKNEYPSVLEALFEVQSNYYNRKIWKRSKGQKSFL